MTETLASATAKRDAEVLAARQALARAETEAQRRDAVLREFRAKLAWQSRVDQERITDVIELAARVYVGELSASDALAIARGVAFDEASGVRELQWVTPPELWPELRALFSPREADAIDRVERAIERGDFDLAQRLSRQCVASPAGIGRVCLALRLASQSTSDFADRAATLIREALDPDNPLNEFEPIAQRADVVARCAVALDGSALESAASRARTMLEGIDATDELDVNVTLAVITALACANDLSSAMALWRARFVTRSLDPIALDDALRAHRAIVASLTPEARASWESELADSIDPDTARFDVAAFGEEMRGREREKLLAEASRRARSALASRTVVDWISSEREGASNRAIGRRTTADLRARSLEINSIIEPNRFDEALVSWLVDHYGRLGEEKGAIEQALRRSIVRAGQRGFAQALVCIREMPVERLFSTPRFYDGLPVELVRELLARRPTSASPSPIGPWIFALDSALDPPTRERVDAILAAANVRFTTSSTPIDLRLPALDDPRNSVWIDAWPEQATREFLSRDAAGRALGARRAEVAMRLWRDEDFVEWCDAYEALLECIEFASEQTLSVCEGVTWSAETSALAHRAILRERELRARRGIAARDLGPVAQRAFKQIAAEEPGDSWEGLVRGLLGHRRFKGLRAGFEAIAMTTDERAIATDIVKLGIVDEAIDASKGLYADCRVRLLSELWSAMTPEDRARTLPWMEARIREFVWTDASPALVRDLSVELLIELWGAMVGSTVNQLCSRAQAIRRLAGEEALVQLAAEIVGFHTQIEGKPMLLVGQRGTVL
ncbi:MAG: hypothetical protein JNK05_13780 [Myxococcales bacterium]|nr:hypothetical protein [Myxococcales bacterium]